jgi:phage terminase Nu1 subunit (DNA packaging protein)
MKKYNVFKKMWFLSLLLMTFMAGCASNGGDPASLVSLRVTPVSYSIPVTGTLQYSVLAIYGDGSSRDVTSASSWSAGSTGVTFGSIKGLASGALANPVPVVITAGFNGITGTASLTVNAATSMGLKLSPATASIPVTGNQQYTLLEIFNDGTSQIRTTDLATTWTLANNSGNITLTPKGIGAGLANGISATPAGTPVTITAAYGGRSATANLTVNAATSMGLRLSPATASIPVTGNQQYTLLEIFSDGTSQLRTAELVTTWTAANNSGAITLSPGGTGAGLANGLKATPSGTPVTITAAYGGRSATASLTVNAATSMGLTLSPATASIPVTGNQRYTLLEIFSDGTSQLRTDDLTTVWSSPNNSGNITLSPSGSGAGLADGIKATTSPITITAAYGGKNATASLSVTAATSMGLRLSPASAAIPVTGNQQYTLLEIFSDGTSQLRTDDPATIWSAASNFGNISLTPGGPGAGLAIGLKATSSPVTITTTFGGKMATASLSVNAATSKGLLLSPATTSLPVTGNQQYTVHEIFSDGTSQLRTDDVNTTWSVVNNAGNISLTPGGPGAGFAIGLKATTTPVTITAAFGGKSASASVAVNAATSMGLTLSPANASIPVTGNQQYTLLEIFSDGTSQLRTTDPATTWSTTNNAGNITLSPSGNGAGLANGLKATPAGTPVTITAAYGGRSVTATVTVNAATSIGLKLSPATASIPVTGNQQYTLLEIFSDGTSQLRTADPATTWSALNSNGNISITPGGSGAGLTNGLIATPAGTPVTITTTYGGRSVSATLTVNAATSIGLKLSPASTSIPVTGNQQYTLLEIFSDGTSQLRTDDPATTWSATNNVGNISLTTGGLGAGLAIGLKATTSPVTITTAFGGKTAIASLSVNAAISKGLLLSPATTSIPVTGNQQYTVHEIFSDGTSQLRTDDVNTTWSVLNNAGTISLTPGGLGAGLAIGLKATTSPVTITAAFGGKSATASLSVNAATSKGLLLSPALASLPVTGNQQYTLYEIFSDGTSQLRTTDPATTWSVVNNTGNISLTPGGVGAGLAVGLKATTSPVTITAAFGGKSVSVSLTVNAATSMGLALSPALSALPVSANQQYTLLEIFSDGTSQSRTEDNSTVWSTVNNAGNVSLTPAGLGAGLAKGLTATPAGTPVTVGASYNGTTVTAALTVNAATSVSFKVTPFTATIAITGGGQQFAAIETFSDGTTFDRTTDLATTWSSLDLTGGPNVATIGLKTGIATGAAIGTTTIKATYSIAGITKTASSVLTVTAPDRGPAKPMVLLGAAGTYGMIASDAMTITASPTTHIYGDVALINNDSFVGFALTGVPPAVSSIYVTGQINSKTLGNPAAAVQAQADLNAAYLNLKTRVATTIFPSVAATELSGMILEPGIYEVTTPTSQTVALSNINGPVIIDAKGNPDALFIIKTFAMTTTTGSVVLQNGAQAKNVFWFVTTDATIGNGSGTFFQGTVVAGNTITVGLNTSVQGRMLAGALGAGAITSSGVITVPK